jgi:hypothetical protein
MEGIVAGLSRHPLPQKEIKKEVYVWPIPLAAEKSWQSEFLLLMRSIS